MVRLLIDENFNHRIVRGLKRRLLALDCILTQNVGLKGAKDPALLASAAEQGRVIVTHDVNTLAGHAYERCEAGLPMPGVIAIPKSLPIGQAIEELLLVLECVEPPELEGLVVHLPLGRRGFGSGPARFLNRPNRCPLSSHPPPDQPFNGRKTEIFQESVKILKETLAAAV